MPHPLLYGHGPEGYGKLGGDMYGDYSRLFAGGGGGDYSKLLGAGLGGGMGPYNPFMQAPYMNMNVGQPNIPGIIPTTY